MSNLLMQCLRMEPQVRVPLSYPVQAESLVGQLSREIWNPLDQQVVLKDSLNSVVSCKSARAMSLLFELEGGKGGTGGLSYDRISPSNKAGNASSTPPPSRQTDSLAHFRAPDVPGVLICYKQSRCGVPLFLCNGGLSVTNRAGLWSKCWLSLDM